MATISNSTSINSCNNTLYNTNNANNNINNINNNINKRHQIPSLSNGFSVRRSFSAKRCPHRKEKDEKIEEIIKNCT